MLGVVDIRKGVAMGLFVFFVTSHFYLYIIKNLRIKYCGSNFIIFTRCRRVQICSHRRGGLLTLVRDFLSNYTLQVVVVLGNPSITEAGQFLSLLAHSILERLLLSLEI